MQVELKDIQRKLGIATIFVTHDQSEALSLSDRLAVMSEGVIHQVGTPQEVYASPADRLVASFIGDASVITGVVESLADTRATIKVGDAHVSASRTHLPQEAVGTPVDLFIRPEQITLAAPGEAAPLTGCRPR
jgi:ABC-type Fe3+/spermidine/putrescine transport system ATPase subunit